MKLFASTILLCASMAAADVDVYLIGGQSNALGQGLASELPSNLAANYPAVKYYFRDTGVAPGEDTAGPLFSTSTYTYRFGPEVTMGRQLDDLSSNKVAIIKYAVSGSTLGADWFAGGNATATGDAPHLKTFYSTVTDGMAAMQAAYPGETLRLKGMAWMQGESDVYNSNYYNNYETRLRTLVQDIRLTLSPDLKFAIGRLSTNQALFIGQPGFATIRNAQAKIAGESALNVLVNTDAIAVFPTEDIHFNTQGQRDLGILFANALVPEPGSAMALVMIGAAVGMRRRRR